MSWSVPLLAVAWLGAASQAQNPDPRAGRDGLRLDGLWEIRVVEGGNAPAGETWRPIYVPSAFETVLGNDFDGVAEYRKRFRLPAPRENERVYARFAAVMTEARVFFNEVEVGTHLGGWTPFRCPLPRAAFRDGEQELRVVVDEKVGHNTQGFLPAIQPHFGGIWQSVEVVRLGASALDPDAVEVRTSWAGGRPRIRVTWPSRAGALRLTLRDGERVLLEKALSCQAERPSTERTAMVTAPVRSWSPADPAIYRLELASDGDRLERDVAFRSIEVDGRNIRLNGKPLHVRGVLHWGFGPPRLAPNPPASVWRDEMRWAKACGFNMIKACLWVPPPSFFAVALEEGMLVWQEYPTWHPDFSPKHRDALLAEYREFFELDRGRAPVVVRSLTCETGRGADPKVVEELYATCKRVTGAKLVEDDSSWISWNRFHDFYDDHPYGNCGPWLSRLRGFDDYIEKHGAKPFLLGEAIAADTWIELGRLERLLAGRSLWWKPYALPSMRAFETRVEAALGKEAAGRLVPDSMRYAMAARKYQIESFRRVLPEAGYVASVMRDFMRARMGFFDDLGRAKWGPGEFSWHGEHMLVLDDPRPIRSLSFGVVQTFQPSLRVAGDVRGLGKRVLGLRTRTERWQDGGWQPEIGADSRWKRVLEPESPLLSKPISFGIWDGAVPRGEALRRCRVSVELEGVARNAWTFYSPPALGGTDTDDLPQSVKIARDVTPELLAWVENGGRLLLLPGGRGGLKSQGLWFLQGAPFAPVEHPLFERVPRDLLFDLQPLDFDGPLFRLTRLARGFDVVLGFWDTHDEHEKVQELAFLLEARAGKGRVLACSLNLDLAPEPAFDRAASARPNPARAWLRRALLSHLLRGPAPRAVLTDGLLAAWKSACAAEKVELGGTWLLKPDPEDAGRAAGWMRVELDDADWIKSRAGAHWEVAGLPHYTGIAWYRKRFAPPQTWRQGRPLHAIFDGVDDSYVLFVNGKRVAAFGDPETKETVWLVRTHVDIGPFLQPGSNLMALRVVDHQGAGGLHRKVWLSTGAPSTEELVNK